MPTFNSPHDEYLWEGAVVSGVVTGEGSPDHPVGWFAGITLDPTQGHDELAATTHYGTTFLILHESNAGTVTVVPFETEVARNRRLIELSHALRMHDAGLADKDVADAISGYRRALEWDSGHDGEGMSWDEDAQRITGDDVTEFLLANIEDVRTYMQVTDQTFEGVGGDFAFTRVESDAARMGGFQRLAEGETVDDLVAGATRFGKVVVLVNEKQEMEVHPA